MHPWNADFSVTSLPCRKSPRKMKKSEKNQKLVIADEIEFVIPKVHGKRSNLHIWVYATHNVFYNFISDLKKSENTMKSPKFEKHS
jgi:hypothetical protein